MSAQLQSVISILILIFCFFLIRLLFKKSLKYHIFLVGLKTFPKLYSKTNVRISAVYFWIFPYFQLVKITRLLFKKYFKYNIFLVGKNIIQNYIPKFISIFIINPL